MVESALSLGWSDIAGTVARTVLNYSRDSDNWSTEQAEEIERAVDTGYRSFLTQHDWSFIQKGAQIVTTAPYTTGTIALADGDATVTLTDGTWPSWAAQGTLYYDGVEYDVSSRTSDSEIELASDWDGYAVAAGSYELRRIAYDLPDDFGQPKNWFTYDTRYQRCPIQRLGWEGVNAMRSGMTTSGYPSHAAIRPKTGSFDGTAGERFEVAFYPLADGAYTLGYVYYLLAATRMRTATPYPLGGMAHAQAIQDCCIAAARYLYDDMQLLDYKREVGAACIDSIRMDNQMRPSNLGYNGDNSDGRITRWSDENSRVVTVNSVIPGY